MPVGEENVVFEVGRGDVFDGTAEFVDFGLDFGGECCGGEDC